MRLLSNNAPSGWQINLLDKVAIRRSGHTPSKSNDTYWNGGVKWVSLADSSRLDQGEINHTDKEISELGIKNSSAVMLPQGTVIISRDAGVGKSAVLSQEMAVSQHFITWQCDNEKGLHNWFLYYWLQLNKREFERMAVGSTIKTIGLPFFKKIKIAHPEYSEQKKIAQILSTWDKGIETVEKLIENSQQKKKALMQQLLTGKKRFPEFDGEWKEVRLGNIVEITTGSSKTKYIDENGGRFILDMGSVSRDGKLIPSKRTSYADNHLFKGQLVMPKDDIGGGNIIGRVGYVDQDDKYILGDHVYALSVNTVDPLFLSYLINGFTVNKSLRRKANGTAQLGLGRKDVEKQVIVIPPSVKEQQQITSALSSADQEIKTWQQELAHLKQEKKALMQQLLTGKRRVKLSKQENHHANLL